MASHSASSSLTHSFAHRIAHTWDVAGAAALAAEIDKAIGAIAEAPSDTQRRQRSRLRVHLQTCKTRQALLELERYAVLSNADGLHGVVKHMLNHDLDAALQDLAHLQQHVMTNA